MSTCAVSLDALNPNVAWMLWRAAERAGARPAVIERGGAVTYAGLVDCATAIARALGAAGLAPGDRVVILLERGADAVAAYFGALAAGAIAVLVIDTLKPRQLDHILTHSGARYPITGGELLTRHPYSLGRVRVVDVHAIGAGDHTFHPLRRVGGDVAQIVYTSGSTGLAKGVTVSHANLWAASRAVVSYLGITSADRIASLLQFSFVYGLSQMLCAVSAGAGLVVERSPLLGQVVETLRRNG